MEQLLPLLAAFDRIGAGSVKKEEISPVLQALQQPAPSDAELDGMIAYVDEEQKKGAQSCPQNLSVDVGSGIRRHSSAADGLKTTIANIPDCKTYYDFFQFAAKAFADTPLSGTRTGDGPYEWKTYKEVNADVDALGAGLVSLCGLPEGGKIGVCSQTRHEWLVTRHAASAYNLPIVTMYDSYGTDALEYIINVTELSCVIVQDTKLDKLLTVLPKCPTVKHVVVIGSPSAENLGAVGKTAKGHAFSDVVAHGAKNPLPHRPPKPDDLVIICYTSGTTGEPKGVVHRHKTWICTYSETPLAFPKGHIHISFLPMAHVMELYLQDCFMLCGMSFAFYRGDALKIMEDIQAARPHVFVTVPRLLTRIYDKMMAGVNATDGMKRKLFDIAYESKKKRLAQGFVRSFWDFIVFKKMQAALGGRVEFIGTGSAPIAPAMLEFLKIVFSSTVVEGYGMSEVLITNFSHPFDSRAGNVGPPLPHIEIKLESVPDMNYSADADPPRGEVCFRGPTLMTEYFKRPDITAETIDKDGWLHSGDIGQWEPHGALKLIDRKKNIFKLANGEYIAPEKVENVYVRSNMVAQAFVTGDSLKNFLVGIIIPDPEVLAVWAKANNVEGDVASLLKNPKVKEAILEDIKTTAKAGGLSSLEIFKDFDLHGEAFSVENGFLTPSFKLKRNEVHKQFADKVAEMYKRNEA